MVIMEKRIRRAVNVLLTIAPIAAAVLGTAYLVTHRPGPSEKAATEIVRPLRVLSTPVVDLIPRVAGYGVAQPGRIWEAVAEVKGTIASVHPHLKSGELIKAGTPLIRMDPKEYELVVAQLEANVEETRAKIRELEAEAANTQRLLGVEQRSMGLARNSLERKRTMLLRKVLSQDEVDREERQVLEQEQHVEELKNTLALVPSRRKALNAALAAQEARLKQARIDLTKTILSAPFDCRLGDVNIEAGQFVRTGQTLFSAHATALTEVEGRFRVEEMQNLLSQQKRDRFQPGLGTGAFQEIFRDVRVRISLESADGSAQWEGRIDRIRETVDPKTREIKVVAAVDRPYEKAVPGVRPPLMAGMFCRVTLLGPVRPGSVLVPRSALHENAVFVVDDDNRLQRRPVEVDFTQEDGVIIRSGLSGGEEVVVGDPSPAIIGMKVSPVRDDRLRQHLIDQSQGQKEHP